MGHRGSGVNVRTWDGAIIIIKFKVKNIVAFEDFEDSGKTLP